MRLRAIFWSRIVLPARGGDTIRPRWPLPMGVTRSTTRMLISSADDSRMRRLIRRMAVDGIDLHEGEIVLAFDGKTDGAFDDKAGLQAHAADLAGGDVDVFR